MLRQICGTLILGIAGSLLLAEPRASSPCEAVKREAAIRELVRRGAVIKRFEVRETETAGLLVRLKANHLDAHGVIDAEIVSTLSPLDDLSVELRGVPLSDEGLKRLIMNASPIGLDLSGSGISNRGLEEFRTAEARLHLLDLSFTRIGDEGLARLTSLTELRHLSLIESRVTDAGLNSLAKLGALRELYLAGTSVTVDGVRRLQDQLPKCRIAR